MEGRPIHGDRRNGFADVFGGSSPGGRWCAVSAGRVSCSNSMSTGIGNIYAVESLWRANSPQAWASAAPLLLVRSFLDSRQPARLRPVPSRRTRSARRRRRGDGGSTRRGRHLVRRALRERQRPIRLFRTLPCRLRPRARTVPSLRSACSAGKIHESFLVFLPAVPTEASRSLAGASYLSCRRFGKSVRPWRKDTCASSPTT